jgi:hypothetical protein
MKAFILSTAWSRSLLVRSPHEDLGPAFFSQHLHFPVLDLPLPVSQVAKDPVFLSKFLLSFWPYGSAAMVFVPAAEAFSLLI